MRTAARPASSGPPWAGPVGAWLRWGALVVAGVLILAGARPVEALWLLLSGGLLLVLALAATLTGAHRGRDAVSWLVLESGLAVLAVLLSGGWASPWGLYLAVPVLGTVLLVGAPGVVLPVAVVGTVALVEALRATPVTPGGALPLVLPVLVATAGGLVGRRQGPAPPAGPETHGLGGVRQLGHVNALLSSLHGLVRSTPAPLTVEDVLGAVHGELEELFEPDATVLLLAGPDGRWWRSVDVAGATPVGEVALADLPAELHDAGLRDQPVLVSRLGRGSGLTPDARWGVYQWLFARGGAAALLALERREPRDVPAAHLETLGQLATPLALALDNAVWFRRLRTLGAEDERQRLGAQLHDRFAQSLAYLALELDRAATRHADDPELRAVRDEVRRTLLELRATLRDLRLRCTEERGLAAVLAEHLPGVEERAGLQVDLDVPDAFPRLPLPVEDHLLRAVQDLLTFAGAQPDVGRVVVRLLAEDDRLRVVVRDDGPGVAEERLGRESAALLAAVRDRADAIQALVDVRTRPGEGTEIAVTLRRA
jgi:signal transduction histidine kinase